MKPWWPTCGRCEREVEAGFSYCAPCADEVWVKKLRAEEPAPKGESMKQLMIVVVMAVVAMMLGGCSSVTREAPAADEPAARPVLELDLVCSSDADCRDADPCVARSTCNPGGEYSDARGCDRTYRVKGEACGGGADEQGNWGACAYTTDDQVVGAAVACVAES